MIFFTHFTQKDKKNILNCAKLRIEVHKLLPFTRLTNFVNPSLSVFIHFSNKIYRKLFFAWARGMNPTSPLLYS